MISYYDKWLQPAETALREGISMRGGIVLWFWTIIVGAVLDAHRKNVQAGGQLFRASQKHKSVGSQLSVHHAEQMHAVFCGNIQHHIAEQYPIKNGQ